MNTEVQGIVILILLIILQIKETRAFWKKACLNCVKDPCIVYNLASKIK